MSEYKTNLSTVPVASHLLSLLGHLASRWRELGQQLNIGKAKLDEIQHHFKLCDQRLSEMLFYWLVTCGNCSWADMQKALEAIGERKLANCLPLFVERLQEMTHPKYNNCKIWPPTTKYWRLGVHFEPDRLAHRFDPTLRKSAKEILMNYQEANSKWYEIGTALAVPKFELDRIKELLGADDNLKFLLVIEIWIGLDDQHSWRKLIEALIETNLETVANAVEEDARKEIKARNKRERDEKKKCAFPNWHYKKFNGRSDFTSLEAEPRHKELIKIIRDYLELPHTMCDRDILDNLSQYTSQYNIVEVHILERLEELRELYGNYYREWDEDKKTAQQIQHTLRTRRKYAERYKRDLEKEKNRIRLPLSLLNFRSSSTSEKIQLLALESDMHHVETKLQEINELLRKYTEKINLASNEYDGLSTLLNSDGLYKSQQYRIREQSLHALIATSSKIRLIYETPTVNRLIYVLGALSNRWHKIGKLLEVEPTILDSIEQQYKSNYYRCMVEMFHHWIASNRECNWSTIIKIIKELDEVKLANTVEHYVKEMVRIEHHHSRRKTVHAIKLKPMTKYCYEDWWVKHLRFQWDTLAQFCDPTLKQSMSKIERCLLREPTKWYEIGVALDMPKSELDAIRANQGTVEKALSKMIHTWAHGLEWSWRSLVDALIEIGRAETAKSIEELATGAKKTQLPKCQIYQPEFRRKDFSDKITKRKTVSADKVHKRKDFTAKDHLKKGEEVRKQTDERFKEIKDRLKQLNEDKKLIQENRDKLGKQKQELEDYKKTLKQEEEEINEEIKNVLDSGQPALRKLPLLNMLQNNKEYIREKLQRVNRKLTECIQALEVTTNNYNFIIKQLKQCHSDLKDCQDKLQDTINITKEFVKKMALRDETNFLDTIGRTITVTFTIAIFYSITWLACFAWGLEVTSIFPSVLIAAVLCAVISLYTIPLPSPANRNEEYRNTYSICDKNIEQSRRAVDKLEEIIKEIENVQENIQRTLKKG